MGYETILNISCFALASKKGKDKRQDSKRVLRNWGRGVSLHQMVLLVS